MIQKNEICILCIMYYTVFLSYFRISCILYFHALMKRNIKDKNTGKKEHTKLQPIRREVEMGKNKGTSTWIPDRKNKAAYKRKRKIPKRCQNANAGRSNTQLAKQQRPTVNDEGGTNTRTKIEPQRRGHQNRASRTKASR